MDNFLDKLDKEIDLFDERFSAIQAILNTYTNSSLENPGPLKNTEITPRETPWRITF